MAGRQAHMRRRASLLNDQATDSNFELLCPELLDCILQKAVADDPSCLTQLERVNKAFRGCLRRCSKTLLLGGSDNEGSEKQGKPLRGVGVRKALSEELSLRPKLSQLVVARDAWEALFPAVSKLQWTKAVAKIRSEYDLEKLVKLFAASEESLLSLEVDLGSCCTFDTIIKCIVGATPKLESLLLRGTWQKMTPRSWAGPIGESENSLLSLEFALNTGFDNLADVSDYLPDCLSSLRSLKVQCMYDEYFVGASQPALVLGHLEKLQIFSWGKEASECMLQDAYHHCPKLRHLLLYESPFSTNPPTPERGTLAIPDLSRKCPDLERLIVCRGEVVIRPHFAALIRSCGLRVPKSMLKSKILILEDERHEGKKFCGAQCSVTFFRCIVPLDAPWLGHDHRETRTRLLGKTATVNSWFKAFCEPGV